MFIESDQKILEVNVLDMIQAEVKWLKSVSCEELPSHEAQALLTGHLKLTAALFSCYGLYL